MPYLKVWEGRIESGRDAGYPQDKMALIKSIEDLAESYNPKAQYYRLEPIDVTAVVQTVKDFTKS